MKALNDYVIVIQEETNKDNKTVGGIILTTEVNTGHKPGRVIAVGCNVKNVEPGQICYFNWQTSQPFTDDGQKMAAVKEEQIFAVFE
jgi:co-chaperonin GroES (HSP10)